MIGNLVAGAEARPEAPALAGRGWSVGYGALLLGARARAAWMHRRGVRAGDTVALSLERDAAQIVRQVELFYALAWLGAPILPLYPGVPAAARAAIVARFGARWIVSADPAEAAPGSTRLDPCEIEVAQAARDHTAAPRGDAPERPSFYDFSSGTTGAAKVVRFTSAQLAARTATNKHGYAWTASDRVVPALRWPTKVGVRLLLISHAAGAALVDEGFPDTRQRLAEAIEELGVTCVTSSPWQLRRLLASETPAGVRAPRLRFLNTAGAHVSPEEIRAAREEITTNFYVAYACTEAGKIAYLSPGDPADAPFARVPGFEVEPVDERDRPLAAGQTGRLRVRAPWLPRGYAGDEAASAERFRDGWFYPGDLGCLDAAGRIALYGRSDDIVNYGGLKILPRDVEQALATHPEVVQAALVGVPDPMAGEVPVVFVVLRRPVPAGDLTAHCASRLDHGQVPRIFFGVPELPRNPEGKVLRERLRELYLAWRSQQAGRSEPTETRSRA